MLEHCCSSSSLAQFINTNFMLDLFAWRWFCTCSMRLPTQTLCCFYRKRMPPSKKLCTKSMMLKDIRAHTHDSTYKKFSDRSIFDTRQRQVFLSPCVCVHMETISDNTLHLKGTASRCLHKIYWNCCAFGTIASMHFPIVNFNAYIVQLLCHSDIWMHTHIHILFTCLALYCTYMLLHLRSCHCWSSCSCFQSHSNRFLWTFMDVALQRVPSSQGLLFSFCYFSGMLCYPSHLPYTSVCVYATLIFTVCCFVDFP